MTKQQAGHRLVDAALDGARVVVDGHAQFAQRVQDAQPHRHLLEAAAGDAAHQDGVGQPVAVARQIVAYAWAMVAWSLLLIPAGHTGPVYATSAVVSGGFRFLP